MRWFDSITDPLNGREFEQTPGDSAGQEPGMLQSMRLQRVRHDLATEQQLYALKKIKSTAILGCSLSA